MKTKHLLIASLVILSIVFIGLQLMEKEVIASFVRAIFMVALVITYGYKRENINSLIRLAVSAFL